MSRARPASPGLALCALLLAVMIACRPSATPTPRDQSYFPLELGERWIYDTVFNGPTPRTATSVVAVCRVREADNVGTMFLISTCADDQLVEASLVYRHGPEVVEPILVNRDGEARPRDPPEVIARSDMRVGQAWRWEGKAGEDERTSVYMVTNQGSVFTPSGELHGVRMLVTNPTTGASNASVERWFAPGIGLVKEAGALTFALDGGQTGQIELVRTLREHGIVPVESIPCCAQVPAGAAG